MCDMLTTNTDILRSMKQNSHITYHELEYKPLPLETESKTEPDNGHTNETLIQQDFSKESVRLGTYKNWKSDAVTPEALAKAGFYSLNSSSKPDLVKCAFCKAEICSWETGDDAFEEHAKWSPNCPFIKETNSRVVPSGEDVCGNLERFPNSVPESETFRRLRAMIKSYEDVKTRLDSFATWPTSSKQKKEVLAEAGFYYRGVEDHTICFSCGGALKDWKDEDEPWEQHAMWFPTCAHLIASKGQQFVDEIQKKFKASVPSSNLTKEEVKSECGRSVSEEGVLLCKICDRFERNTIFMPCKHILACTECSDLMDKCPVCRRIIDSKIKVFIS